MNEKTADEMFRELGYKKVSINPEYGAEYRKAWKYGEDNIEEVIEIDSEDEKTEGCVFKMRWETGFKHWDEGILSFPEVLACAQLIKEMRKEQTE